MLEVETPAEKYTAFEQRVAPPNSMEDTEKLLEKIISEAVVDWHEKYLDSFLYGRKQYPLSQQDAFQKDKQ